MAVLPSDVVLAGYVSNGNFGGKIYEPKHKSGGDGPFPFLLAYSANGKFIVCRPDDHHGAAGIEPRFRKKNGCQLWSVSQHRTVLFGESKEVWVPSPDGSQVARVKPAPNEDFAKDSIEITDRVSGAVREIGLDEHVVHSAVAMLPGRRVSRPEVIAFTEAGLLVEVKDLMTQYLTGATRAVWYVNPSNGASASPTLVEGTVLPSRCGPIFVASEPSEDTCVTLGAEIKPVDLPVPWAGQRRHSPADPIVPVIGEDRNGPLTTWHMGYYRISDGSVNPMFSWRTAMKSSRPNFDLSANRAALTTADRPYDLGIYNFLEPVGTEVLHPVD